jgi:uncharacterized protein YacL
MKRSSIISKSLFTVFCFLAMMGYLTYLTPEAPPSSFFSGLIVATSICAALWIADSILKQLSLQKLNLFLFGTLVGYFLYKASSYFLSPFIENLLFPFENITALGLLLISSYLGISITFRSQQELAISLPFIRLKSTQGSQRLLIMDTSLVLDQRFIDLATTGLLDNCLILPKFILQEIQQSKQSKQGLDVIKRLEDMEHISLTHNNTDFTDLEEPKEKLTRLANLLSASVLTGDPSPLQHRSASETVRFISISALATALKPTNQTGDFIQIKIQRYGKEPRQGIGYLDDGTMVVINGGGDFIGKIIKASVLSVKHSSTGRIIFCNVSEEQEDEFLEEEQYQDLANSVS